MTPGDVKAVFEWVAWGARVARWLGAGGLVRDVKLYAVRSTLKRYHFAVLHRMRDFARRVAREGGAFTELEDVGGLAEMAGQICTESRVLLGELLGLPAPFLHCCFKAILRPDPRDGEERVATWVRSEPVDSRPLEIGPDNAHLVSRNSAWACLRGQSDGRTIWPTFDCFSCNDLVAAGADFVCDRHNWQDFYRSTAVFPVRYPVGLHGRDRRVLGFIAFDSPKAGAFRGMPNVFEFKNDPTGHREALERSPIFHVGAVIADTAAAILGTAYQSARYATKRQQESGNEQPT